jgi:hypothetical protein
MELEKMLEEYLKTLTPLELKGYYIAKDHLGCTFDLKKSLGFLSYKKKITATVENMGDIK